MSTELMLSNPFWFALRTEHARFAIGNDRVLRYPFDVLPFAGLENYSAEQVSALGALLRPGETIYVAADSVAEVDELPEVSDLPGLQLHFSGTSNPFDPQIVGAEIRKLRPDEASSMMSLTDIAFPGFFRQRTYELGSYLGVLCNGLLVAMAGERIALPGIREVSAVCTHPDYTGNGYATALIQHLLRSHAERGLKSFLHVAEQNKRAVSLYQHLGFVTAGSIHFRALRKQDR
jgi:ribosomal protein S18 acetylase RimI-like enzyme